MCWQTKWQFQKSCHIISAKCSQYRDIGPYRPVPSNNIENGIILYIVYKQIKPLHKHFVQNILSMSPSKAHAARDHFLKIYFKIFFLSLDFHELWGSDTSASHVSDGFVAHASRLKPFRLLLYFHVITVIR